MPFWIRSLWHDDNVSVPKWPWTKVIFDINPSPPKWKVFRQQAKPIASPRNDNKHHHVKNIFRLARVVFLIVYKQRREFNLAHNVAPKTEPNEWKNFRSYERYLFYEPR